ncbi:GNAT family N-acetyltransferase [Massilia sp.]|uniref:GNAT family N-acetyltransferase n=1 Tax=Massilia sp. TaxID=1882437 RepID=UPI0028A9E116|nr:GNAT family N-acetyltransferase [Massilia sp.]
MTITLRDVTEENFETLMDMELPAHQRDLLHTNAYSIAQAKFYDCLVPRAIYQGERAVGFAMYNRADDGRPGHYGIYRFMVDFALQSQGIGRRAMELLLEEIKAAPDVEVINICYHPHNARAGVFYRSFGFVEIGIDCNQEMVAEIRLR